MIALVLWLCLESHARFSAELPVVAELDAIAGAHARAAYAAQDLGIHRQQKGFRRGQPYEIVLGSRFGGVKGKQQRHAAGLLLNTHDPKTLLVHPDGAGIRRIVQLRRSLDAPVRMLALYV